jgi:hypothetical protein
VLGGLVAADLLVGFLIPDALQPSRYSPLRQTTSVTAGYGGTDRWVMTTVFVLISGGYLLMAGILDRPRRARIALVIATIAGIGIAGSPEPAVGSTRSMAGGRPIGTTVLTVWPALLLETALTVLVRPAGGEPGRDGRLRRPTAVAQRRDPLRRAAGPGRAGDLHGGAVLAVRRCPRTGRSADARDHRLAAAARVGAATSDGDCRAYRDCQGPLGA